MEKNALQPLNRVLIAKGHTLRREQQWGVPRGRQEGGLSLTLVGGSDSWS